MPEVLERSPAASIPTKSDHESLNPGRSRRFLSEGRRSVGLQTFSSTPDKREVGSSTLPRPMK